MSSSNPYGTPASNIPASSKARRSAPMFAPHTTSISRSSGPPSSVVIGGASRPHMRSRDPSSRSSIGPPRTWASGWRSRPASSSRSHPGGASTSSSTNTTKRSVARLDPGVAGRVEARDAGALDVAHAGLAPRRHVRVRRTGRRPPRSPRTRRDRGPAPRANRARPADSAARSRVGTITEASITRESNSISARAANHSRRPARLSGHHRGLAAAGRPCRRGAARSRPLGRRGVERLPDRAPPAAHRAAHRPGRGGRDAPRRSAARCAATNRARSSTRPCSRRCSSRAARLKGARAALRRAHRRQPAGPRERRPALAGAPGAARAWACCCPRRGRRACPREPRPGQHVVRLPFPVAMPDAVVTDREPLVVCYAGNPEKKGLDTIVQAWAAADPRGRQLLVTGIAPADGREFLRTRGLDEPAGLEWAGTLEPQRHSAQLAARRGLPVRVALRGLRDRAARGARRAARRSSRQLPRGPTRRSRSRASWKPRSSRRTAARRRSPPRCGPRCEMPAAARAVYSERARELVAPYSEAEVQRRLEQDVIPLLLG